MKTASNVTVIPAKPQTANNRSQYKQLRVAAYCRVSSSSEDQLNSYQAQLTYYSHKFEESDTEELVDLYILKEDDQFTAAFLYRDTAYMVWTEQVDYDECRKIIESFGH